MTNPSRDTLLAWIAAQPEPRPLTSVGLAAARIEEPFSVSGATLPIQTKYAPDMLLTRVAVAGALSAAGFPVSPATLATKATRGGGPPYRLFGRRPLYEWGPALEWARDRLSAPVPNTSAAHVAKERGANEGQAAK
jgi:hypothetical protein